MFKFPIHISVSLFLSVLSLVGLVGCGVRYTVDNETFSSSSEALQKQTTLLSHALGEIIPTDDPVHGTALVIFPSDGEIQKNYIRYGNNASKFPEEAVKFAIASFRNSFQYTADAIRKRGIFDAISVERHNGNPPSLPIGDYDYLVFVDVDGWFIRGKDKPRALPLARSVEVARTLEFLDLLNRKAKDVGPQVTPPVNGRG